MYIIIYIIIILQVSMQTHGQGSTLVSMFRALGIESVTSCGRGAQEMGPYLLISCKIETKV